MLRILYPINLDHWQFPVATSLRELTLRNSHIDCYSFSSPASEEDKTFGQQLWQRPNIHKISALDLPLKQFDIVHHASATPRNLTAANLAKLRSLGQCIHLFTAPIQPHKEDSYYKQYVTSVYKADVLAAVSHAVADDIKAQFDRKVDAVIPSGVDLDFFSPEKASTLDLVKLNIQRPYVLFVSVLTQRKRPDIFIQIAAKLPEFNFVMVGGQYTTEEYNKFAKAAYEFPNIKLMGVCPRTKVRDLMAGALALIFPSELEGLPLTILEATSMGLPVLAQPKSSMPEAVIDDLTGWLLPAENLNIWADKLKEINQWSTVIRHNFSRRAREFTQKNFSWDLIAKQYSDLYEAVARK